MQSFLVRADCRPSQGHMKASVSEMPYIRQDPCHAATSLMGMSYIQAPELFVEMNTIAVHVKRAF